MIVDATNMIVGRMSVHIAKAALLGEEVHVINCEHAIFSGSSDKVLAFFVHRYHRGVPAKGPFIHRKSFEIVKRAIRGMLPYRKAHGEAAFGRIRCYNGVPRAFEGKDFVSFADAHKEKLPVLKFVTVGEISKRLGANQ
jgi:large subunit ribosomal protein L13